MAITVLTDASVTYNSVNLSDHVESVEINMSAEDIDITAMGATSRTHAPGLRDDSVTINFFQDFATGKLDATISPLLGSSAGASLVIKPTSSSVSSTNPSYTMTAIVLDYKPLDGKVGAASQTQVVFKPAANSSLVRATT